MAAGLVAASPVDLTCVGNVSAYALAPYPFSGAACSPHTSAFCPFPLLAAAYAAARGVCDAPPPPPLPPAPPALPPPPPVPATSTCVAGTYEESSGFCEPCPPGWLCAGGVAPFLCPAGASCASGSATSTPCPAGYYCPLAGMVAPALCLPGYLCAATSLTAPSLCPGGFFCPPGCAKPTACPPGKTSANGTASAAGCS